MRCSPACNSAQGQKIHGTADGKAAEILETSFYLLVFFILYESSELVREINSWLTVEMRTGWSLKLCRVFFLEHRHVSRRIVSCRKYPPNLTDIPEDFVEGETASCWLAWVNDLLSPWEFPSLFVCFCYSLTTWYCACAILISTLCSCLYTIIITCVVIILTLTVFNRLNYMFWQILRVPAVTYNSYNTSTGALSDIHTRPWVSCVHTRQSTLPCVIIYTYNQWCIAKFSCIGL